jgi:hypothetical protein
MVEAVAFISKMTDTSAVIFHNRLADLSFEWNSIGFGV